MAIEVEVTLKYNVEDYYAADEIINEVYDALDCAGISHGFYIGSETLHQREDTDD